MMRILALDIDDTLVDTGKQISPRTERAIRAAAAQGILVVLATGRGFRGSRMIREQLGLQGPIINYGGAMVMDAATGTCLMAQYLQPDDVRSAFAAADRYGLHVQAYDGDTVLFRSENEFTARYTGALHLRYTVDPKLLERPLDRVPKVLMYVDPADEVVMAKRLANMLPDSLHVLCSKPGFLEIGCKTATKGRALQWIAQRFDVAQADVVAIGDNTLDLDMIQWAGEGCCVANGNEQVKKAADRILPSCADEGVAVYLEETLGLV